MFSGCYISYSRRCVKYGERSDKEKRLRNVPSRGAYVDGVWTDVVEIGSVYCDICVLSTCFPAILLACDVCSLEAAHFTELVSLKQYQYIASMLSSVRCYATHTRACFQPSNAFTGQNARRIITLRERHNVAPNGEWQLAVRPKSRSLTPWMPILSMEAFLAP